MNMRQALFAATCILLAAAKPAAAQFQSPPQQPPCLTQFAKLRDDAQKKAKRIELASRRKPKPTAKVACQLFTSFSAAESKMLTYAEQNEVWCGIPKKFVEAMKTQHAKTTAIRTHICRVAAAPPVQRGPSLSDALGAPVPNADNIKSGAGGTFDTLTGSPLGK